MSSKLIDIDMFIELVAIGLPSLDADVPKVLRRVCQTVRVAVLPEARVGEF
jgi:hypothetical protein